MTTFTSRSRYLRAALEYIAAYLQTRGYAPTLRELGTAVGANSTGHASYILDALEEDHFLEIPRSLTAAACRASCALPRTPTPCCASGVNNDHPV